ATYHLQTHLAGASSPLVPLPAGRNPRSVAGGDVNGDGLPDLVSANSDDDTLSVFLGNGDGIFRPRYDLAVGDQPSAVLITDLDADRRLDLVSVNHGSDTLSVFLGNGDVNGDGIADLVVANQGTKRDPGSTLSVLLGDGRGNFLLSRTITVGFEPVAVAVADVTGDGL